jgi:riboflavin biosynthesis pyrimidine reductase
VSEALRRLLGTDEHAGAVRSAQLPDALHERYDGDLVVPLVAGRPTVIANFVSTLDGVVSFDPDSGKGGAEVSGFFEPDRFVMALLRAIADFVIVGAGTVRADPRGRWISASVHPATAVDTAAVRSQLGLAPNPTTVVVSASGDVAHDHPGLADPDIPVLIVTTTRGENHLADAAALAPHIEVEVMHGERVDPRAIVDLLGRRGAQVVLTEGGPHLIAQFAEARLLDELFLTVAPQLAGRTADGQHLALLEGRAFEPEEAPWGELVDLRVSGSHLFTRYRFGGKQ